MLSLTTIKARAKRGDFDGKQRSTACTIMNTLADGNLKITVRGRDRIVSFQSSADRTKGERILVAIKL